MNVVVRSLLARVWDTVSHSEERVELGAKKSRFTFVSVISLPVPHSHHL